MERERNRKRDRGRDNERELITLFIVRQVGGLELEIKLYFQKQLYFCIFDFVFMVMKYLFVINIVRVFKINLIDVIFCFKIRLIYF